MKFLNKYFSTPKIGLSFYINENTILMFVLYIIMLMLSDNGIIGNIFMIAYFILCVYTFSWRASYNLYLVATGRGSKFIAGFIYAPYFIFTKSSFDIANDRASRALYDYRYDKFQDRYVPHDNSTSEFMKGFKSIVLMKIFAIPFSLIVLLITPFIHIKTMDEYTHVLRNSGN